MRGRARTLATLATIGGLVLTAGGVTATSASWMDSVDFAIEVTGATTSTSTTTTSTTTTSTTTTTSMPTTTTSSTSTTTTSTSTTTTTSTSTTTSSTTTTTQPPPPSVTSGGISAANPETVITAIVWDQPAAGQVCTQVAVTGIDSTAWDWAIKIDLTAAPWYGTLPQHVSVRGSGTTTELSPTQVLVTGRSNGGPWDPYEQHADHQHADGPHHHLQPDTTCSGTAADSSWYTVSAVLQPVTKTEACVVVTATPTPLASGPFFFGWTSTVDLRAAKAASSPPAGPPRRSAGRHNRTAPRLFGEPERLQHTARHLHDHQRLRLRTARRRRPEDHDRVRVRQVRFERPDDNRCGR